MENETGSSVNWERQRKCVSSGNVGWKVRLGRLKTPRLPGSHYCSSDISVELYGFILWQDQNFNPDHVINLNVITILLIVFQRDCNKRVLNFFILL